MAVASVLLALGLGFGAYGCSSAREAIASDMTAQVPRWAHEQGFVGNEAALAGARLFAESGCTNCHTYLGSGSSNLGAPDLSAEGAKRRSIRRQVAFLRCPQCSTANAVMPPFRALGEANLRKLAVFLDVSKGRH